MKRTIITVATLATLAGCGSVSSVSPPPTSVVSVTPTLPVSAPTPPQRCHAHHGLPDRTCTPGALNLSVTQASLSSTICKSGWTATVRPPSSYTGPLKTRQITQYGYTDTSPAGYEEDHLVPLELGGNPTSPANLWPEPEAGTYGFHAKDKVENAARAAVCDGRRTLAAMQHAMEVNWEALGRRLAASTSPPARTSPPVPTRTRIAAPPPPASASCHPTSSTGHCYKPGQFCRTADRGLTGTTASGAPITCRYVSGRWHWEPS